MLYFDAVAYLLLYFYLEEVIPNEYGISRSPFYFLKIKYWRDLINRKNYQSSEQSRSYQNLIEDDSSRGVNLQSSNN